MQKLLRIVITRAVRDQVLPKCKVKIVINRVNRTLTHMQQDENKAEILTSAVSRVWRRDDTNISAGLCGECSLMAA